MSSIRSGKFSYKPPGSSSGHSDFEYGPDIGAHTRFEKSDQKTIELKRKMRPLRIRMLDGSVKTVLVDESQTVANLMVIICTKIGLTNHDEYSLVREVADELKKSDHSSRTLTLRREKRDKDKTVDQTMETLKKKLKTDDDLDWVDQSKTLPDQGIGENETLLLRRKFFFSDSNIDSGDPVQLNLLYVQTRDAIIKGTHPVTQEQAITFAGIQCQIQYGDHSESKHRTGFLDLKDYLPKELVKVKRIEKFIFTAHRKQFGLSELDAKVKYVQLARSLKTYGVTFFLVKEKIKGKNKLSPRLLGVTKDSVLRLDERTKEILETWPLTTVKRWAASPNSFTLDFGDYSDSYYSVQTNEGEQIAQLIAGYIDIILKRKKAKDHFGIEGDEGSTMVEDSVAPYKATILQYQPAPSPKLAQPEVNSIAMPAVLRAATKEPEITIERSMPPVQMTTVKGHAHVGHVPSNEIKKPAIHSTGLSGPQRALLSTIEAGKEVIKKAEKELSSKARLPDIGNDPSAKKWKQSQMDVKKQNVASQLSAMNAATAQLVTLTGVPPKELETMAPAIGAAVSTITSNLPEMSKDVRVIATLMEDEAKGDELLDAARRLCKAFSDLLKAAEPTSKPSRPQLLNSAGRVGEASHAVLATIGEEDECDRETTDILLSIAKHVANAAATLVLKAKDVTAKCDPSDQAKVIESANECALATSQLVTTAKVVSPTIQNPSCQKELTEACKKVARAVENVLKACQLSCKDPKLIADLREAAAAVTRALNQLLDQVNMYGSHRAKKVTENDGPVDTIIDATDKLFSSTGDAGEMVKQAKVLAQATSQLITDIKGKAGTQSDSDIQKRLLAAARVLADATSRLVDAAKGCATNPHDSKSQAALKKAAEDVVNATNTAVSNALRKKVINRLEVCARQTASAATQNIAAIHGAGQHNTNRILHDELELICSEVSDSMPSVVSGIKDVHTNPDDPVAQIQLINACEAFIDPTSRMANTSKAAIPNISDPSSSLSLRNSAQQLDEAISELKISLIKAQEACYTSFEIENAIEAVKELIVEVNGNKKAAVRGTLKPLPGETIERCITQLSVDCKTVGSGMAELLTAASQGNEVHVGAAARDTTIALRDMTRSVRGVAATSSDPEFQVRTLQNSIDVLQKSIELFEETKWALENINDKERQPRLTYVAKNVSNALSNCINSMPGHRDIDDAIRTINESNTLFTSVSSSSMSSKKSYVDLSNNLIAAANRLNESASDVVANSRSPVNLSSSSKRFTTVFGSFATTGMEMVGGIKDESIRKTMVSSLQSISSSSSKLLLSARSVSSDPHSLSAKNTLGASQRSLSDAISNLINLCSTGAPGQTEVDAAIRRIQMAKPMLDNTIEPINLLSYFNCLDGIVTISQKLRDIMTNIGNSAERCESETFCNSVREGADSICDLIETSAQSAYLIAAADSTSVAGRPGLVDISTFHKSNDAITEACEKLTDRSSSQQQILAAATAIARHTSSLCNSCRLASSRTNNPIAKRHFVQSAKDVANATAALVKEIKTLDSQPNSEVVRKHCSQATKPLIEAVQNLTAFASSDEFAGIPARISDKARLSQLPITSAAKQTCDSFCNLLTTAKSLILKPQDGPGWSMLSTHGESVDTSVQTLISALKEAAPGQRECDLAIEKLRRNIRDLDSASMSLHQQTLSPRADHSFKTYREILHSTLLEIADKIDPLRVTGKCEAESLGHRVTGFSAYFDPLVDNVIGAISKISNGRIQSTLFSQTKTVCECGLQMVFSVKESGGNAKNTDTHADVDEAGECLKEAINDLSHTLQTTSPGAAHVPVVVDSISKSIGRMDGRYSFSGDLIDPNLSFVDYQTRMINLLREITRIAQEINTKSVNKEVDQLGELTNQLASNFSSLTLNTIGAVGTTANYEVGNRIKSSVQELGSACIQLTKVTGGVQDDPDDLRAQHDVTQQSHHVCEKASYVLAALQAGSRGTQACINAASVVSGIIGDLDTTIMFATAGTLNPEDPDDSFAAHRESILKCAKALVEDTKALFVGAASDQEKLADAAGSAVEAIVKLADEVKQGATSLGSRNSEAQVLLLNSAKDVATALGDLVIATKSASGKSNDDPTMISMKESAKHMISNVTSLLKTVKTVEDEHQRGTRALEQTIAAIDQELRLFDSSEPPRKHSTPEDLIRITKPVTIATAKSVAAGNSGRQDDIITAANLGRKAIFDLLVTTRQAAYASDSSELRSRTLDVGRGCALKYRQLLQMVRQCVQRSSGATNEERQILIEMSRDIASSVTEIVSCAEMLKGSDWVDPDDPTVIAETELLGAAASIDAAAQKLASLQPRRVSIKLPHDDMSFDEMILEAAKSITAATAALLRAACAAQRELVAAGRLSNHPVSRSDDGEWSEGLISAARLVAAATHSLVEAANALVQGHASEEKLISAAKQVATSTAHLLVACQVKADPDSKTMLRLQAAGNAVKRATDALVLAAQRAIEVNEETSLVISKRKVPSIAIEISAREEILRKERELHEARDKLAAIHKAKYNQKGREYYDLSYSGSS